MSANSVATLTGLPALQHLQVLNLASNRLQDVADMPPLSALTRLSLAHNAISSLSGLTALETAPLQVLDVRNNHIAQLTELAVLTPISALQRLNVSGGSHPNQIAALPTLIAAVTTALPQVRYCVVCKGFLIGKLSATLVMLGDVSDCQIHQLPCSQPVVRVLRTIFNCKHAQML